MCEDEYTEVFTKLEEWQERAVLAETGQTKTIRDSRVLRSECVALDRAERVTNVEDLLELWHTLDLASAQHIGQSLKSRDLKPKGEVC